MESSKVGAKFWKGETYSRTLLEFFCGIEEVLDFIFRVWNWS